MTAELFENFDQNSGGKLSWQYIRWFLWRIMPSLIFGSEFFKISDDSGIRFCTAQILETFVVCSQINRVSFSMIRGYPINIEFFTISCSFIVEKIKSWMLIWLKSRQWYHFWYYFTIKMMNEPAKPHLRVNNDTCQFHYFWIFYFFPPKIIMHQVTNTTTLLYF